MYILISRDLSVELSESDKGFKRFKKQICKFGEYVNPNGVGKMVLDRAFGEKMKANFESRKYGVVAVPLGHPRTAQELAELNKGEMIDIEVTDSGIDAVIEIRDPKTAESIENRNIPDVSMGFDENYLDKRTGKRIGPLLKHVGLVVDPYIKGMSQFVPLGDDMPAMLFSDQEVINTKEEEVNLVKITNDRVFDIEVKYIENEEEVTKTIKAGEELEVPEDQAEDVKKQIANAEAPKEEKEESETPEFSEDEVKQKELADREAELTKREAELARKENEAKFNQLLADGKVVPAQKEAFMALSEVASQEIHLSDDETKTVDVLLSEFIDLAPKVGLTDELGADTDENGGGEKVELSEADRAYIARFGLDEAEYIETKKEGVK